MMMGLAQTQPIAGNVFITQWSWANWATPGAGAGEQDPNLKSEIVAG